MVWMAGRSPHRSSAFDPAYQVVGEIPPLGFTFGLSAARNEPSSISRPRNPSAALASPAEMARDAATRARATAAEIGRENSERCITPYRRLIFAGDGCFRWVGSAFGPRGDQVFLQAVEGRMLKLALFFFIISIIAGVFGFTGISAVAAGIAKVLFFIFIIVFMVLLVVGLVVGSAIF
jgi:uncharacterized membrane protein YtjA (UPF0391 family)